MSEVGESSSAAARQAEFKKRLRQLHDRRFEARKANRAEVVEEDRREKLPPNFEQKLARKQWQIDDLERRKDFEERGEDYERARMLETQADSADKVSAAKRRKQNPDSGFTTYDAMTLRQYQSQTKQMKPDMKNYAVEKADKGSAFYPTVNTLLQGSHYPSRDNITKMTEDLEKTIETRQILAPSHIRSGCAVGLYQRAQSQVQRQVGTFLRRVHKGHPSEYRARNGCLINPSIFTLFSGLVLLALNVCFQHFPIDCVYQLIRVYSSLLSVNVNIFKIESICKKSIFA